MIAGGLAVFMPLDLWREMRSAIITALSVIGAASLIRLSRGFPFANMDSLDLEESRRLAIAVRKTMLALRALIIVILFAMGGLIALTPFMAFIGSLDISSALISVSQQSYSFVLAFIIVYSFCRTFMVIQGDISLFDLQADLLEQSVRRKNADAASEIAGAPETKSFKNPPGYGEVLE